ncbi:chalcone isomerase-like protein [Thiogranum longum]|uniref:Chalcone isomerase-like protein n=1 Tax=Thiogranum longum TaxID=1537524 RepID=A0A4R1HEM7_9GAMM|nr:chalcone isomerase family protein [Thiogranum longum]TCK19181.1 chalcone isomerase-like protein [Thiogranum longum]
MLKYLRILFYFSLIATPLLAQAVTKVAGIDVSGSCSLDGQSMKLNGAGIRSKYFIKIYVGVLCLEHPAHDPATILAASGAKRMQMNMLYKEVDAEKITEGWTEGFRTNLDKATFSRLEPRLKQFNTLFPALHKGDVVNMDYLPGRGTGLVINGKSLGVIEGEDFFNALLQVWIGRHPADKSLKKGLLGK